MNLRNFTSAILFFMPFGMMLRDYERLTDFLLFASGYITFVILVSFFILRGGKRPRHDYLLLMGILLYLVGLYGALAAVSSLAIRLLLAAAASVLLFFRIVSFSKTPVWNLNEWFTVGTGALLLLGQWAWNFYFTPAWYLVLFAAASLFFLLFWQAGREQGLFPIRAVEGALVGSLLMVEVTWSLLFWPTHFFTIAAVSFAPFYLIYVLSSLYFTKRLSKRQAYFQIGAVAAMVIIVMLSSPWQPIK